MKHIRVFLPDESQICAYLPEHRARSLYVDPRTEMDEHTLTLLNQNGFRRSGQVVYRPECDHCQACMSVRIYVPSMQLSRSQKRILRKNHDLVLSVEQPIDGALHYPIYDKYIRQRHHDGDMYPPNFQQYQGFLLEDFGNSRFLSAYKDNQLVGSLVFDSLEDGLSAVYCFFDPQQAYRSPAMFLILSLSLIARNLQLPYNYLGYYIKNCPKMTYKNQFRPLEIFNGQSWQPQTNSP